MMASEKEDEHASREVSSETVDKVESGTKKSTAKKKKVRKPIDYYSFIKLPHNYDFFPNPDRNEYIKLAGSIREVIVRAIKDKPLSTSQIDKILTKINPDYSFAIDYLLETADDDSDEHYQECKKAVEMIKRGIEIRTRGKTDYWGLVSKLDSA
jgi:hypothetical protein